MPQKKFVLADHPRCCLCGGARAATTEEHCPPKIFFSNHSQYPREADHKFPSCEVCQKRSKPYDQFFAWMTFSSFSPAEMTREYARYQKVFQGVTNNNAAEIAQVRSMITPQRSPEGYPILPTHSGPTAEAIRIMGWKLFCTSHYKHTERDQPIDRILVSKTGLIAFNARLNLHNLDWEKLEEFRLLSWAPILTSSDKNMGATSDRFVYRHMPHPNGNLHAFSLLLLPFVLYHGFTVSDYQIMSDDEIACLRIANHLIRPLPAGPTNFDMLRLSALHGKNRRRRR